MELYFKLSHDRILPYYCKFISHHHHHDHQGICLERMRKTTENLTFSSVLADAGYGYLPNTSYRHTHLLSDMWSSLLHFVGQRNTIFVGVTSVSCFARFSNNS